MIHHYIVCECACVCVRVDVLFYAVVGKHVQPLTVYLALFKRARARAHLHTFSVCISESVNAERVCG